MLRKSGRKRRKSFSCSHLTFCWKPRNICILCSVPTKSDTVCWAISTNATQSHASVKLKTKGWNICRRYKTRILQPRLQFILSLFFTLYSMHCANIRLTECKNERKKPNKVWVKQSNILDSYFVTYLMHHDIFVLHESAKIEMKIRKKRKKEASWIKKTATTTTTNQN